MKANNQTFVWSIASNVAEQQKGSSKITSKQIIKSKGQKILFAYSTSVVIW